jgi:hypothetical protein
MAATISWRNIFDLNQDQIKDPNLIYPGQELSMPDGSSYTVVKGDSLSKIAAEYNRAHQEPEDSLSDDEANAIESSEDSPTEDDVTAYMARHPDDESTPAKPAAPVVQAEVPKPSMNPLHSYATYTYGITLFVLSKDSYKELVNGTASSNWKPTYSLISSGGNFHGVPGQSGSRHPAFHDDFYFDNLRMSTIIGMNSDTRGTNAIDLSFTIIEPYGLTLLDRIIEVSLDKKVDSKNYLQQPYLLQVDFYGADELGKLHTPIPELQKRIPIKLLEMKIKVGSKGAEYAFKAVPFNHGAMLESTNSTPANFEIGAKTVGDFFGSMQQDDISAQVAAKDQARSDEILARGIVNDDDGNPLPGVGRVGLGGDEKALAAAQKTINAPYSVKSYAGAWNSFQQKAKDTEKIKVANQIAFEIDPEIRDSDIVDPTKMPYARSKMEQGKEVDKSAAQSNNAEVGAKTPANNFDPKQMLFNVTSGTSIVDVVNLVLKNSDYIKRQVVDPLTDKNTLPEETTVKYFKVIPKVELLDFDAIRNDWGKKTTFYIKKYEYFNSKHPNLPTAKPRGAVKEYNYFYTGKNIDILELNIDFDTAYYTTIVVNREKAEATSGAIGADEGGAEKDKTKRAPGAGTATPATQQIVGTDATAQSTGADTAKTVLVSNAMKSIYSSSRGDMLNVKLKILGDPHFIKQDDLYANPGQSTYDDSKVMINPGSLNMDASEIFCKINFETPVDMDDKTGLRRDNPKYRNSGFSGFYKILKVDSEFSKGQFVQTLDCIRIFDKTDNAATGPGNERAENNKGLMNEQLADQNQRDAEDPAGLDTSDEETTTDSDELVQLSGPTDDEEFDTPEDSADDVEFPEEDNAAFEGQQIADDLSDAEELDIGDQLARESTNPEPENP